MTALKLEVADFATFFSMKEDEDELDLSNATLTAILREYEKQKRNLNPGYSVSSLIYNIELVEKAHGTTLSSKRVNENFYGLFISFLSERGLLLSTIKTYCTQLCAALRWAQRYNARLSSTFDSFKIADFRKEVVALTPDEVSFIYHFDIDRTFVKGKNGKKVPRHHRENLKRVRDQLVLSCNLGQRYSDMVRINPTCFNSDKTVFSIVQQKTGNKAIVDLRDMTIDRRVTREILERYQFSAPYPHDISNYNKLLHELLDEIGGVFNDNVKTEYKTNGEIKEITISKGRAIGSHTGRRTFATYHISRNISEAKIRKATGHKDSKSFCRYVIWDNE